MWLPCGRPLRWAPVSVKGQKGLCHIISHRDRDEFPLSVAKEKVAWARRAGATWTRLWVSPRRIGTPENRKRTQQLFDMLQGAGIEPVVAISHDWQQDLDLKDWAKLCADTAYLLPAKHWALINEADNFVEWHPQRYAEYLHIAADTLRGIRPDSRIAAPSLGHGEFWPMGKFLEEIDPADLDVLTLHPYARAWGYVNAALKLIPDKPVWVEEDGSTSWTEACMRGSAYEYLRHPRIERWSWYCLADYALPKNSLLAWEFVNGLPVFEPTRAYKTFAAIEAKE